MKFCLGAFLKLLNEIRHRELEIDICVILFTFLCYFNSSNNVKHRR